MRNPNTTCEVCSKKFYKRPSSKLKYAKNYCSQQCYGKSCKKPIHCVVCKTEITNKRTKTCSKACFDTLLKDPNRNFSKGRKRATSLKYNAKSFRRNFLNTRNYKCEICQYALVECLHIHHIVERQDGGSDNFSNLLLLCPNCHSEIHSGYREPNGTWKEAR